MIRGFEANSTLLT